MATSKILEGSDASAVEETCKTFGITLQEFRDLQAGAIAAKSAAYCPYSQFRVGATILVSDGSYISGCNVENASYPVGTCAERVAFGTAVAMGLKKFRALSVATDISPPASPCGMCRQFIREFCDTQLPILMFDKDGNYLVTRLEQLLPLSFGPEALPSPESLAAARAHRN